MASPELQSQELSTADKLDDEIAKLRAQAALLASKPVQDLLSPQRDDDPALAAQPGSDKDRLASLATDQKAHGQQCLYRACASVTTFRVRDPDPCAVDGGRVLGVRFEVMSRTRFARPYYVMLNRPYPGSPRHLRVHRHTVPACVPLSGLAARHLPPPGPRSPDAEADRGEETPRGKQDLPRFVRALRRELVRYHNRVAVVGDLRKAVGLDGGKRRREGADTETETDRSAAIAVVDVSAADAEAKQIRIEWADGRSGRLVMNDDGGIVRMVVQGADGRDRETARQFLGGAVRIEEIARHLESTSASTK
ncbi:hypothetical protein DL764_000112 [Monosporascus ibericus]|uniref:Cenp-O kinetochore centromere component n=1 Tax=Monosporascus ibericus TaxID=155417 RepID=A0A4Q4TXB9_9PEZI|nr:hypothetical protein DL764_000112 [Monosporascus ibericus]